MRSDTDIDRSAKDADWIEGQHRSMRRWVGAKVGRPVADLLAEVCDGLLLIELTNKIIAEVSERLPHDKLYMLQPLYKRPHHQLQKYENVADYLQFVRLVLNLSACNISADDIVQGNLKLVLGLVWSLFVFSAASTMSGFMPNAGRSFFEVKAILLRWLNPILYKKGIESISNFGRDFSLETSRPDLYFFAILDHYLPNRYGFDVNVKKLQNLTRAMEIGAEFGISQLADPENFLALVPDEICIVSYVSGWFQTFEVDAVWEDVSGSRGMASESLPLSLSHISASSPKLNQWADEHSIDLDDVLVGMIEEVDKVDFSLKEGHENDELYFENPTLDVLLDTIVESESIKHRYEKRALRFHVDVKHETSRLKRNKNFFCGFSLDDINEKLMTCVTYCNEAFADNTIHNENLHSFFKVAELVIARCNLLVGALKEYETFRSNKKQKLLYKDAIELEKLYRVINDKIHSVGIDCDYKPSTHFDFVSGVKDLCTRIERTDAAFLETARQALQLLQDSALKELNGQLSVVEEVSEKYRHLDGHSEEKALIYSSLERFECFMNISHQLDYHARNLDIGSSPSSIRTLLKTSLESPGVSVDSTKDLYSTFKKIAKSKMYLLHLECETFLQLIVSTKYWSENRETIASFKNLIPIFHFNLKSSESDSSILMHSDIGHNNSMESFSIFEESAKVSKHLSTGTLDAYDLSTFMENIDNGFAI